MCPPQVGRRRELPNFERVGRPWVESKITFEESEKEKKLGKARKEVQKIISHGFKPYLVFFPLFFFLEEDERLDRGW